MHAYHLPGLAACLVKNNHIVWSKGYGWADIERRAPMTPDTLLNIASVSKTITNAAIMQLWEQGCFRLDENINGFLPFVVRNPSHPNEPITYRQLLTHTSSINDGAAYKASYACGDPTISLRNWIEGYLAPGGGSYNETENFHSWKPGDRFHYSNVGFGLLGYLVEVISGSSFSDFCKTNIFEPLGMDETAWYLADLDRAKHAQPYTYVSSKGQTWDDLLQKGNQTKGAPGIEGFIPNCLYSFPNYPDGLLRTSVRQLARFLISHMNDDAFQDKRILQQNTIETIFTVQIDSSQLPAERGSVGLTWYRFELETGDFVWGHNGGDPGVTTLMQFRPADETGVILFANADWEGELADIAARLYHEALSW